MLTISLTQGTIGEHSDNIVNELCGKDLFS